MTRTGKRHEKLEARLGYRFADPDLLDRALTHSSAVSPAKRIAQSYQRLEFLGDRVLGLVVADMLYRTLPQGQRGRTSRSLNTLVRKETCAADRPRARSRRRAQSRRERGPHRRRQKGSHPRRRRRGGDRRHLLRRRAGPGLRDDRAPVRRAHRARPATSAPTPRRRCRNGRRAGASSRRLMPRSSAPAPTTRPNSPSP